MKLEIDLEVGGMPDFRKAKRGDEKAEGSNHQPLRFFSWASRSGL
jgi:hypothetical protein